MKTISVSFFHYYFCPFWTSLSRTLAFTPLGALLCFAVLAQAPCNTGSPNLISQLPTNDDGTTTVTYSVDGEGADAIATQAFSAWNAVSADTGVEFEPAAAGTQGDVTISFSGLPTCISTNQTTGEISYGSALQPEVTGAYQADGVLTFEHEIGHLLRLDEDTTDANDVMNQTQGCTPADRDFNSDGRIPPTAADAAKAGGCIGKEKSKCSAGGE